MVPSLIAQLKIFLASLATIAMSITPIPSQQAVTSNTNSAPNVASNGNSRNWSGYVASSGTYTTVNGTWTVPQISTSGHTASDATWVGIGGVSGNDLIQSGTQNVISPSGQVSTIAFYELLPNMSTQITSVPVKPGDSVTVAISEQATNQWLINFTDNSTGQNYQTTVTYDSSMSSAEWIEEAPSDGVTVLPLDSFGSVQFSAGSATQNGSSVSISASSANAVTMVNGSGQAITSPSTLGSDGASFTVTRTSAISNAPVPGYDRNPESWRRRGRGIGFVVHFVRGNYPNPPQVTPYPTSTPQPTSASPSGQFHPRWRQFRFRKW
jgi:hypothetical protein